MRQGRQRHRRYRVSQVFLKLGGGAENYGGIATISYRRSRCIHSAVNIINFYGLCTYIYMGFYSLYVISFFFSFAFFQKFLIASFVYQSKWVNSWSWNNFTLFLFCRKLSQSFHRCTDQNLWNSVASIYLSPLPLLF